MLETGRRMDAFVLPCHTTVVEITRSWADFSLASGNVEFVVCFPTPLRNISYMYMCVSWAEDMSCTVASRD